MSHPSSLSETLSRLSLKPSPQEYYEDQLRKLEIEHERLRKAQIHYNELMDKQKLLNEKQIALDKKRLNSIRFRKNLMSQN